MSGPKLKLRFSTPRHGWLPTRLEIGAEVIEFEASAVPSDPIRSLHLAIVATEAGGHGNVWWHLEPAGYFFELSNRDGAIEFRLMYSQDSESKRKVQLASILGSKKEVLMPLWRALRGLKTMTVQKPHWPGVWMEGLDKLGERLKGGASGSEGFN